MENFENGIDQNFADIIFEIKVYWQVTQYKTKVKNEQLKQNLLLQIKKKQLKGHI